MRNYPDNSLLIMITDSVPEAYRDQESKAAVLYIDKNYLVEVMRKLHDDPRLSFNRLATVTSVDYKEYFEMVYTLFSVAHNHWLTVKVKLEHDNPVVPSITSVYPGAEFEEREVYDLMGIDLTGHPDKRRILLPDTFEGHPLRKDFKQGERPFIQKVKRSGGN